MKTGLFFDMKYIIYICINDFGNNKMSQSIIYNLRELNDRTLLSIDLTGSIVSENHENIIISINNKLLTIQKSRYLNTMKIIDDGKLFFIVCNKQIDRTYALKVLLEYAVRKIDSRIDFITTLRQQFVKELSQLKLKAA